MVGSRKPGQPRVFISYARSDGEAIANGLRTLLEQHAIPLWQDRANMRGGDDWWLQIVKALDTVEFMVMVMTPAALRSPIVRKEWRYARQQGVCVYPIKAMPDLDFSTVPHWMSSVHWYELEHEQEKFLNDLNRTCEKKYVPFMVADLPGDYVLRAREFSQLRDKLLDETREEPVAITAALRGAGGYGKTTIARALCHDEAIQQAFDDGMLWVTLGENPGNLIGILGDLIYALSHEKLVFDTLTAAITRFVELLADRDLLLVIDDVWDAEHLKPFLQGGKRCARLITTRNEQVLPSKAEQIRVEAMQTDEAVRLLSADLDDHCTPDADRLLQRLAGRLGKWPLLLKLVNGILRDRVGRGEMLPDALTFVNEALDEEGLTTFDDENTQDHHRAVARTIGISLQRLTAAEREHYRELAIFPEDVDIPLATVQRFWKHTGNLSRIKAELFCQRLAQLSLLLEYDLARRTLRLHDVIRTYLRDTALEALPTLNQQFLTAYNLPRWSDLPLDEPYLWTALAGHLIDAQRADDLLATVRDGSYLATKAHLYGAYAVETDLELAEQHHPADLSLSHLKRFFRGIGHLLNQCATQHELASTLHAYLSSSPEFVEICVSLEQRLARPFITAWYPLPDQPSPALIRTLSGHTNGVNGCAISPSGEWVVSCSDDETLKIWDAQTGKERLTLQGHHDWVNGCAVSPSGEWVVSCSDDKTLRIWDTRTGKEHMTLEGHTGAVKRCGVSPSGEWIVSCSDDKTLKIWDAHTGQERMIFEGHTDAVNGCVFSPSGEWIVSCSDDKTLKVWDTRTGKERLTLQGHHDWVNGCAVSPSGEWIVSCSSDKTLKIWDAQTGKERLTLQGHHDWVNGCVFSPSGEWIVSCSSDETLKIWDVHTGQELITLEGHTDWVNGCVFSPSGEWIVSCSDDKTLKIWDAHIGQELIALEGHTDSVRGCAISSSGEWIASCSSDKTLRIWDAHTGQERMIFEGHTDWVNGCVFSPSGEWIVSCSGDKTLKIWDAHTGQEHMALEGHTDWINGCVISPSGEWIVSCSSDKTLKVWASQTGKERMTFEGHTDAVNGCAISPSGEWIVSCSSDKTLKVWDAHTGKERMTLGDHTGGVRGCGVSPSGEWIVSCSDDKTLKVWASQTGKEHMTLEGHSSEVRGCAISPSGEWIISCSLDKTLKVWDVRTGAIIMTLRVDASLHACTFTPDGEHIIAVGDSGVYFLRIVR